MVKSRFVPEGGTAVAKGEMVNSGASVVKSVPLATEIQMRLGVILADAMPGNLSESISASLLIEDLLTVTV